jgi:hypothetical protein
VQKRGKSMQTGAPGYSRTGCMGVHTNVLKIKETHDLQDIEYKYYAPGVGVIKEEPEDEEVTLRSHR